MNGMIHMLKTDPSKQRIIPGFLGRKLMSRELEDKTSMSIVPAQARPNLEGKSLFSICGATS